MSGRTTQPFVEPGQRVKVHPYGDGTVEGLLHSGLVLRVVRLDDGRRISILPWAAQPLEVANAS